MDGNALAVLTSSKSARGFSELSAHSVVFVGVEAWSPDIVDSHGRELVKGVLPLALGATLRPDSARCEHHDLEEIVSEEVLLTVSQAVEHLDGALREAQVEDFIDACHFLDG